jgi:hypothetical protein
MKLFSNLWFWTIHGIICAIPTFVFAYMVQFNTIWHCIGMILGVVTIILIYSFLTARGLLKLDRNGSTFSRVLRLTADLRAWYAVISLLSFVSSGLQWLIIPDLYAGIFGLMGVETFLKFCGVNSAPYLNSMPRLTPFIGPDIVSRQLFTVGHTWLNTLATGFVFSVFFFVLVAGMYLIFYLFNKSLGSVTGFGLRQ